MHFLRYGILFGVLFITFPESPSSHSTPTTTAAPDFLLMQYSAYVDSFLAETQIPGAAIAIVKDGKIVYMKGYGARKVGTAEAMDLNTAFRIASLSKGFASILTGLLVQEGVLHWEDPVVKYLPNFSLKDPARTNTLTIRNILSHTSGLLSHTYDNLIEDEVGFEEVMQQLKEAPISCAVGECYAYQNVVYSLIGPILEAATHKTYEELLTERIFKPLGMYDASLTKSGLLATANFAQPHIMRKSHWQTTTIQDAYYSVQPAAGVNASIHDMAIWLRALMGGAPEVIPPSVVAQVSEPLVATPREKRRFNWNRRLRSAHYGLGWRIFDYAGHKMVFHSGGVKGYLCQIAFLPEEKIGIVVLQNSWNGNPLLYEFFDRYMKL